jgi:hypothetical protein
MRTVLRNAGFWVGLIVLFFVTDVVAFRVRGRLLPARQLTVDGVLLGGAVLMIIVLQGATYFRHRQPKEPLSRWPFLDGMVVAGLFGSPVLLLLVSLGPGLNSLDVQREYVITPPSPPPVNNMGTVVMFPNGISAIRQSEALRLKQQIDILNHCSAGDLRVVGFASSAPYLDFNEERNLRLANARAGAVVKALEKVQVKARVDGWKTFEDMTAQRRIRDTDADGKRIEKLQVLNRRAEILWQEKAGCGQ